MNDNDDKLNITDDVLRYIAMERLAENRRDEAIRNNEIMRLTAFKIVMELGNMIEDMAGEPTKARYGDQWINPFVQEEVRNELLWMVVEYLSYSMIDRTDEFYEDLPRCHQLNSEYHVGYFFGVSVQHSFIDGHNHSKHIPDDWGHIWHHKKNK